MELEHTWLNSEMQNLVNRFNRLVFRCMQNNNQGAQKAQSASDATQMSEFLSQQEGCQHSPDNYEMGIEWYVQVQRGE